MHNKTRNTYRNPQWEQQLTTNQLQNNHRLRFRRGVFFSFVSTKLSSLSIYSYIPAFHGWYTQLSRVLRYPMIRYSVCSPIQFLMLVSELRYTMCTDINWAMSRENLSSGCPTKRVSNQSLQLRRLSRKLKIHLHQVYICNF